MNILHVVWRPRIGGAELFALGLACRQACDHRVTIWYLGAAVDELPCDRPVPMLAGGMRSGFDVINLWRFLRFVAEGNFDVIHNHQNLPAAIAAILGAPRALHVRHEHGTSRPGWKTMRERWLSRVINHRVALYIANSYSTRDKVIRYEHVPPEKLNMVPCGIDLPRFQSRRTEGSLRSELGIPQDVPVIGFLGRLHPQKGVDDYLAVCMLLLRKLPSAHFVMTGDGPLRKEIDAMGARCSLDEKLHLFGFRDDVPAVLAAYDVLVISSRWEPQGLVAAEAMASGVPVVAFAVDGLPEVIGTAGILIEGRDREAMADAVIRVVEDAELRNQLVARGKQRAASFDLDLINRRIVTLYEDYLRKINRCV